MGSGRWSTNVYDEKNRIKDASGKTDFDYSYNMHRTSREKWRVHQTLDPLGVEFRDSCESAEHPNPTSIVVMFDVTGSMREVPVELQKKLPDLLGLLLRKGYADDPQILFGAIGDATCDAVPLQVGQFESDNRMDDHLENIFLEGGGGGQRTESYELAMYFIARHTRLDSWEKRGRKGYFFMIGDEMAYPFVKKGEVQSHISDGLQRDIPVAEIVRELQKRYHVFYILPKAASYGGDRQILSFWRALLGEHVLELDETSAVSETIALTIGMMEGRIDLGVGAADLKDLGESDATIKQVTSALAKIPSGAAPVMVSGGLLSGLLRR